jgi:hypothetical protein
MVMSAQFLSANRHVLSSAITTVAIERWTRRLRQLHKVQYVARCKPRSTQLTLNRCDGCLRRCSGVWVHTRVGSQSPPAVSRRGWMRAAETLRESLWVRQQAYAYGQHVRIAAHKRLRIYGNPWSPRTTHQNFSGGSFVGSK